MKIALAQVSLPRSFEDGLGEVLRNVELAADRGVRVLCFPECVLKGMRGYGSLLGPLEEKELAIALERVQRAAADRRINVILPTERSWSGEWQNGAYVVSSFGAILGYQTKNQLPPEEEPYYKPGSCRQLFQLEGVPIGIVICHEGWRYPETVRWAARRGAKVVFHPNFTQASEPGTLERHQPWGATYYERAAACRAGENHVWFASSNWALPQQESVSCVVAPDGSCLAASPRFEPDFLVAEIDHNVATGFLAERLAHERYREA